MGTHDRAGAATPEELHGRFAAAMNSAQLDALVALYEPEAALVVPPTGPTVVGMSAIREALERVLALKGTMTFETICCVRAGELALLRGKWTLAGSGPDQTPLTMSGESAEVARRQADGRWLFAIDHPMGGGSR